MGIAVRSATSFWCKVSSLQRHISCNSIWCTMCHFGLSVALVGCTPGSCQKSPANTRTGTRSAAFPQLDDALEILLRELGDLVDCDHVVLCQAVHHFHRILVEEDEEECAGAGVHVRPGVLAPDPRCLLGRETLGFKVSGISRRLNPGP